MSNERPNGNEVNILQDNRLYVQPGGARPDSPALYYGQSTNYGIIQGVTIPINGTVTPIWTGDPRITNKYRQVRRAIAPPPLAQATFNFMEKRGTLNRLLAQDCGFTAYNINAGCGDPSSLLYGWEGGKLEIYAEAIIGSINGGNRSDWANNTPVVNQVPATLREIYEIGGVGFGDILGSDIAVEVIDVTFGNVQRCSGCGRANNGTNWRYAIQTFTGSNEASLLYQVVDANNTVVSEGVLDITGIGGSVAPTAVDVVGQYIIVLVASENAYYYAAIDQATGIPGAFTKVTAGFVSTKTPQDLLVYNEHEVYIAANGGYVYKLTNIGSAVEVLTAGGVTVENLNRVAGSGDTIVAAGASGTVIVSLNRGASWALTAAEPSNDAILGLDVRDNVRFWVTTGGGELFYTLDGGETWEEIVLAGSPTSLNDVVFVNDEVGWVAGESSTDALLYYTPDGGADWSTPNSAPRMNGISETAQSINRMAVPSAANTELASNALLIGGLGATTDGYLAFGIGNFF